MYIKLRIYMMGILVLTDSLNTLKSKLSTTQDN